jgi:hypothetical protein
MDIQAVARERTVRWTPAFAILNQTRAVRALPRSPSLAEHRVRHRQLPRRSRAEGGLVLAFAEPDEHENCLVEAGQLADTAAGADLAALGVE